MTSQPAQQQQQPTSSPPMSPNHPQQQQQHQERPDDGMFHRASEKFVDSAAEKAGEETVGYAADNVDEYKAQAQGLWAKYCGCFGSAA